MRYVNARLKENQRAEAYRIYVTESLQLIPQNKYITAHYNDLIKTEPADTRTGDEVALDVITKIGLKFGKGD